MTEIVAAFDFDETLTTRDSVVPFLRQFTSNGRFARSLLPHTARLLPMAARRDRDRLRALATSIVFAGRPVDEVEQVAAAHAKAIVASGLRADTTARLRWHLDEGHRVVIVTASYEPYVRIVAESLGAVAVLGTRLHASDGRYTGRLDGPNCRGPEKVVRLERWLHDAGRSRTDVTVYAYGDSPGDLAMLAWADHPHWVNEPLASVAP